ncbi:prepilin-type N-terminal cleavage/methylation domain-containing protein [Opitutaceae bacterium TAV1]|nr:prepilin-type N-terminal cleavage/methylation domain-containing protein [Opitutaceae bacterium TAV1]
MKTRSSVAPRRGFTLIELLTVVAIIGVLAGILIPVVGKVRGSARTVQCASNLRQIGLAILTYTSDNKDTLPWALKTNNGAWSDQGPPTPPLAAILVPSGMTEADRLTANTVFKCPLLQDNQASTCSYAANCYVLGSENWGDRLRIRRLAEFSRPSATVMIAEKNVEGGKNANKWFDDYSWHYKTGDILIDRHSGKQNMLYVDGHVKRRSMDDITPQEITGR